jgi:hypothetical protein
MYSITSKQKTGKQITSKGLKRFCFLAVVALVGVITPTSVFASTTHSSQGKPAVHQLLHASQKYPQLAIPGDNIEVTLKTGITNIQLQGPVIPQISADALPGTFTFSFHQKSGKTLISIKDFGILDGEAALIRPVRFDDGTTSFYLSAGQSRTLKLTAFMAVGTGTLRWAPLNHYVTDWQFVEETA